MKQYKFFNVVIALIFGFSLFGVPNLSAFAQTTNTITVVNASDDGPGSLRQAIADANPGDYIDFNSQNYTIHLAKPLTINKDLTICCGVTLSGDTDEDGAGEVGVITVTPEVTVNIISLRIKLGSSQYGGAIENYGNLSIGGEIIDNQAAEFGGAIYNEGNLRVGGSINNNRAQKGGAIYNKGYMEIWDSSLLNNYADSEGGAIVNLGTLKIYRTTIAFNSAVLGAGIWNSGTLKTGNTTIASNTASQGGGALYDTGTATTIINSTFSSNTAPNGAGIFSGEEAGTTLINTIVANNTSSSNCFGTIIDGGNNLSWADTTCPGINADPELGPLAGQGGPTPTIALGPGSAAINAGNDTICAGDMVGSLDQAGQRRPQGLHCDIGAFEAVVNIVTNANDSGPGSLRQTIAYAQSGDTITFKNDPYDPYTIHLASPLTIDKDLAIVGLVYLSGDTNSDDVGDVEIMVVNSGINANLIGVVFVDGFSTNGGAIANYGSLGLNGVAFRNNHATGSGGAIYNEGWLGGISGGGLFENNSAQDGGAIYNKGTNWLGDTALRNNNATNNGGGIYNDSSGILDITRVSFEGNTAGFGAGIYNAGNLIITNTTIFSNTAAQVGGGLYDTGTSTITNDTFTDNSAPSGADIYSEGAGTTLENTIVANSADAPENCSGTIIDGGYNLSWPNTSCPGMNADPKLKIVENNYMGEVIAALHYGSAAIDAGNDAVCAYNTLDQRGSGRPAGPHCDIGAVEAEDQVISTPDGRITVDAPAGAFYADLTLSVTDGGTGFVVQTDKGKIQAISAFTVGPTGTQFKIPIRITFRWQDIDNDGTIDGTNLKETNLVVSKDGVVIATCKTPNPTCDTAAKEISVQVSSLSDFVLGASFNEPPVIVSITGPVDPVALGQSINATVEFSDPDEGDTHTVKWIWDDGSTTSAPATVPSVTTSHTYTSPGVYTITATITDAAGESASASFQYVVIYDPNGGFVTGGGWINSPPGAYTPDPTLTGKATFGFVSKYNKGANIPTGNTEFQFKTADFTFSSSSYDWLVVAGTKAQYKGTGTINGAGIYGFLLTASDGAPDKFRIKIWNKVSGQIIYDNQIGASDTTDPVTNIQGGSIVVHK